MKRRNRIILMSAAVLGLAVCAPAARPALAGGAETELVSEEPLVITDDMGRQVAIEGKPRRVAPLIGSFADIWILAGGQESLAATAHDAWTSFSFELDEDVVDLGGVREISLEKLLAARPDLVIGSINTPADTDLLPLLEEMEIPVLYFEVDGFEDYLNMLDACTKITGCLENYRKYGEDVKETVDAAVARQDGSEPTVLYIRASGSSCKSKGGEGSVLGEMLTDLGCRNIADEEPSLLENLSIETILKADPEHIFIVYQGADTTEAEALLQETLLGNPAWQTLTAVKEGRCHVMSHRLFNLKPNAYWGESYETLADILYGEEGTAGETEGSK